MHAVFVKTNNNLEGIKLLEVLVASYDVAIAISKMILHIAIAILLAIVL